MDAIRKIESALAEYEAPPGNMVDRNERVMRILKAREAYTSATDPAAIREVLQTLASKEAELVRLRSEMQALIRAYVNLLETGRDRIISSGGTCDSVEAMEAADPALRQARAALTQPTE